MSIALENTKTQTKDSQAVLSPAVALEYLKEGNQRFVNNSTVQRDLHQQVKDTSVGQYPFAAIVSCIDSRIPTEVIFDQGIGDIFNARVAGNFVNEDILGSLEFACKLAGSKTILILGHTSCGAVKGACDNAQLGNLTQMLQKIMPAVDSTTTEENEERSSKNLKFVNEVAERNVRLTMEATAEQSPVIAEMVKNGEVSIEGAIYDVKTGIVRFL